MAHSGLPFGLGYDRPKILYFCLNITKEKPEQRKRISREVGKHLWQTTIRELKQRRRQRERQKSNRFRLDKTTTLHVQHAFLYISLPSLHDYDMKMSIFTFCGGRERKTTAFFFLILNFRYSFLEFNSRKDCQYLMN